MVNEDKMRLVAMLEERFNILPDEVLNNISFDCDFKIINFLPDIKVKKVIENDVHKRDKNGRYCFDVEKSNIFKIPYRKNIEDLSVIVGENGSGKTTLINQILGLTGLKRNHRIYLIFEANNEFWAYPELPIKTISFPHRFECPYILKFSNANEFSNKDLSSDSNGIDVSNFNNVIKSQKFSSYDKKQKSVLLKEILNQIKFIEDFSTKIKDFVDYTKKGVIVQFQGKALPFTYKSNELLYLDKVIRMKSDVEKDEINFRLVEYFSVLINQMIRYNHLKRSQSYRENFLNFHLALVADRRNIKLQYQAIRDKFKFFIQPQTVTNDLRFYQVEVEDEGIEWIEIWHLLFIFNVYFDYLKTIKNNFDYTYTNQMRDILNEFHDVLLKINEKEKYKYYGNWGFEEWRELLYSVKDLINLDTHENVQTRWNNFWRKNKGLCNKVAEAVGYTSYFKLYENGTSMKYKLIPEKVWEDLEKIVKSGKELKSLQRFENFLYELQDINKDINKDFTKISLIVDCISEIKIPEVLDSIHMQWVGLSSGELGLLKSFANLYSAKINLQGKTFPGVATTNYVLLFDEIDLGLHPEWQRKWISRALPIIEKIFDDKHLQIIITSHSPIFLSDIYRENILFLSKNNEEFKEKSFEKTFGQNIYTLFKNSFFLQDVMGEYAYNTIKDTIEFLTFKINQTDGNLNLNSLFNSLDETKREKMAKKIIDSVGEPIIANQLKELFYRAFPNKNDESIEIRNRIAQLQKNSNNLRGNVLNDAFEITKLSTRIC
ncbi:hypothetical protein SK667_0133 [Streptococcus mitis]|nr:hypothetical protein SK667_0133 [Streptococcus mitis]